MKKAIHLVLISLLLTVSGLAQAQLHKDCSAEVYNDQLLKKDAQFARNQQQIESFTRNFVQAGTANMRSSGPVTIPVVVHVVYNTSVQNISDAQILSQIDALNEDFRKLNADTVNIPAPFKSLTGNMQIEFCLAKRDPSGNPTTGITRTQTSEVSFTSDNKVKFNSTGGKDIWDRNQYLNIWVCYLSGNLGGYAQYPGGSASSDGVVVTYTTFGRTSNVAAPYNLGRVTTHEVGHWLNLRHIWGSSACGDDFVADTPQQDGNNFFCPTYPKMSSCSGSGANGDMFMNHMDYTYDGCKNMFTAGQVARSQALFAPGGARESLLNSLGCIPVGSSSCNIPIGIASSAVTDNAALISWTSNNATSYALRYRALGSSTWLSSNTIGTSIQLTGLTGLTTYEYQLQSICSSSSSSFSPSYTFNTLQLCPVPANLSTTSITTSGATLNWTSTGAVSYNIRYRNVGNSIWTNTTATTNSKVLSGLSSSTSYEFQVLSVCSTVNSAFSASQNFTTLLFCAIPGSVTASNIQNTSTTITWAASGASTYNIRFRPTGASTWTTYSTTNTSQTLNGLTAATTYEVEVQGVCSGTPSAYSSAITFTTTGGAPSCNAPTGLSSTSISQSSAVLNWTSNGSTSYTVRYKLLSASVWVNTTSGTNSISLGGLSASSTYEYQVASVCGTTTSAYSVSSSFTTLSNCNIPAGLSATSLTTNSAVLSWASTGANSYNVRYKATASSTWINTGSAAASMTISGLLSGTVYEFQVSSVCGTTSSAYSTSANFTTTVSCNVPSGLSSSSVSTSGVTLSWNSTGAGSYNVRYRLSGSSTWVSTVSGSTSIGLGGLNSGSTYEYQVESVCGTSTSGYSGSSTFTTLTNCNIPAGLTASAIAHNSATLSWASTGANSYNVRYKLSSGTVWTNTNSAVTSISLGGLISGSSYEFQISSVCATSSSAYSGSSSFTTLMSCDVPVGLSSSSVGNTTAVISWSNSGTSTYAVRNRVAGSSIWTNTTASSNSMQLTGLASSTIYEFQVSSVCGSTSSSFSTSSNFTTTGACTAPTGYAAVINSQTSATISWSNNAAASYKLRYRLLGTNPWTYHNTSNTSYVLNGLSSGSTYEIQLRSECGTTNSAYSQIYTFTTYANCTAPVGLSATVTGNSTATISWQANNSISYTVQYRPMGASVWTSVNTTSTSVTISGLTQGVTYEVQVMSLCTGGQSVFSASIQFSISMPCNVPASLSVGTITASSVNVSWNATSHPSFNIRHRIVGTSSWSLIQGLTSSPYTLQSLASASTYEIEIQGICLDGSSNFGSNVTATTSTQAIPCSNDANEPNDTYSASRRINPNTYYYGLICDNNDQDWFEFKITNSFNNVKIDLSTLPADYDMALYDANLNVISSASTRGNFDEMLIANNLSKGGQYYLKIFGYNGATHPTQNYSLYFSKSRTAYDTNGNMILPTAEPNRTASIYPNPTLGDFNVQMGDMEDENVKVRVLDQTGKVHYDNSLGKVSKGYNLKIERGALTAGLYFIEISTSQTKIIEKLIVY